MSNKVMNEAIPIIERGCAILVYRCEHVLCEHKSVHTKNKRYHGLTVIYLTIHT